MRVENTAYLSCDSTCIHLCRQLLFALILSIFPPAALLAADDRCGVPDEVNELIDTVSRYAAKGAVLSSVEQRQLRRQLIRAQSVISTREDDLGLGSWKPAFDWMVIATQEASTTGRFPDPATLRSRVGVLIAGMRFSCNAGVSGGKGAAWAGQADGTMKNRLKRFMERGVSDLTVLEQSLAGLFLVTFLVPIIIGAIWFSHWIIRTYHTEDKPLHPVSEPISTPPPAPPTGLFNQHECRIHAAVEFDLDVVDVSIVALDEIGALIAPVNSGAYDRIVTLLEERRGNGHCQIMVGPHRLAFLILNHHHGLAAGFFSDPLSPELLETLLNASVTPPVFTPMPTASSPAPELPDD
ncbi:hypothetical protein SAMN04488527_10238 [Aliiroseovarius crassostreae]|uniref:hypothetical protein n=1 Tax=Aliiroseovarius crassostreae TaxID=154981 RepID=UPI0008E042A5|nr:hypothetical protein [Aliiroseovarius crassostreae]SFU40370.1 hypothetical protein SAMN04488527_10238 [Aliiroseovarius crassostreae]